MTYVINLDWHESVGTHWIALHVNGDKITYFDSFGVGRIPKQVKKFIRNKKIITNVYRTLSYDSMMY